MTDKELKIREAFREQADFCKIAGSPLTADILDAVAERGNPQSALSAGMRAMQGNLEGSGKALALRVAGGLHALARSGKADALAAAYRGDGDLAEAVGNALETHDAELVEWLASPPQTNEPARAAYIMAGLMVAADRYPLPIDLMEIGSSAGLVLNLNHYRYDLGGVEIGDPVSPVLIAPEWEGAPPPDVPIELVAHRGVDRNPIHLSTPEAAERLIAYCWPDQIERLARNERAIDLARSFPPPIARGEADAWVEKILASRQADGEMRILFHTIVFQYLSEDAQRRVSDAMAAAGERATENRPLGWLRYEFDDRTKLFALRLKLWPSGEELYLANGHPHGATVEWLH